MNARDMLCTGLLLLSACLIGGCLEQDMTITSEPAGALVYVSDVEVGRTPLTMPFTWYGNYDVILRMDGYETLKTHANINAPVYGLPPVDLLTELAPWTIHDRRYLHFDLKPLELPSDQELIQRAEQMHAETLEPVR